jgi:alpha-galactosidase
MRVLSTMTCCILYAQIAFAADLTGKWVAAAPGPGGRPVEVAWFLTSRGNELSGYVTQGRVTEAVTGGRINNNEVSFTVIRRTPDGDIPTPYTAKITSDGLRIEGPPARGRGARYGFGTPPPVTAPPARTVQIAKRVSTATPPPMPQSAARIDEPPPVEPVPWNRLAKTPPMGWNSWNRFQREVSDRLVRETADAMVRNGMKDAGYLYVNIDDTWEGARDAGGNIRSNEKFPDMKALADYVHGKGLKLGIYSSPGPRTCAGFEGSFGHEEQDARTFAAWGIDYLKYDWCSAGEVYEPSSMQAAYAKMGRALLKSGRAIVYSLCQYGQQNVGEWGAKAGGNLWRTTGDIQDEWSSMSRIGFDQQLGREKFAAPGHWNDPDMLEIGNGGMNDTEYRTHMSLWSLLAAPLLAGNDLRSVAPDVLEILTNKEVIAIDQDSLGAQGTRVAKEGNAEVWSRRLADGSHAVGLFNRGEETARVAMTWSAIGASGARKVRDLWAHADRGAGMEGYWADVPAHGVVLLKVTR